MKFDVDSTVHLMSLLTDLYSDPEAACVREYSTNADDSHKDAGTSRPIEVTTPTSLSSYLRIKDYGLGMNAQTIEDVYSQYGRSTKRTQTNTNGSMGIGGKCALAYTNQFSVVGIRDGIKTHVSVSRDTDGCGVMEIVDESITDEPNGVEIVIPAKKYNNFAAKAQALFRFWPKGTVLLNGVDPSLELKAFSDRIFIVEDSSSYDSDHIVMGNVAYPANDGLSGGSSIHAYNKKSPTLVAFVTMNGSDEIVFTPSREGLNYTQQTTNVIESLRAEYRAKVISDIQSEMVGAKSFSEAYIVYRRLAGIYADHLLQGVTYAGISMPNGYIYIPNTDNTQGNDKVHSKATVWSVNQSRYAVDTSCDISYKMIMESMVIVNYPGTNGVSGPNKAKIKAYCANKGRRVNSNVILLPTASIPGSPWTDDVSTVDWADIRKIKLGPSSGGNYGSRSYGGGYDVYTPDPKHYNGGSYVLTHDLKATDEVVYYSKAQSRDKEFMSSKQRNLFLDWLPGIKIIETALNRHEKLLRLFPKAMTVTEAKSKVGLIVVSSLTDLEKEQIKIQSCSHLDYLKGIDYNEIDDPFLKRAVEVYRMKDTNGILDFKKIDYVTQEKTIAALGKPELLSVQARYPLLTWSSYNAPDHLIYINAKYKALKGI